MVNDALIVVESVYKTYSHGDVKTPALRGVSLDVQRGDFLIITGRNGSGKSTLLRQIGLLDTPDKGTVIIAGVNVANVREKKRSGIRLNNLGYIFQDYALIYELTALENVMLPSMMRQKTSVCKERAAELLDKVGLSKRKHNLPNQLSGGEQQKVAIARALINDPAVIIADEPTANLDSIAAKEVLRLFQSLNQEGHTIIMVTHEQDEVACGNRVIKLSDGVVV